MPTNDERRRVDLLKGRARAMRHEATPAEKRLWVMLRDRRLDAKWRRQRAIGDYIVDFVCLEHKLIVEADGGQHAENAADLRRHTYLSARGFRVLRCWNAEILGNPLGVYEAIAAALHTPHPSAALRLPPSPVPGEGKRNDNG